MQFGIGLGLLRVYEFVFVGTVDNVIAAISPVGGESRPDGYFHAFAI